MKNLKNTSLVQDIFTFSDFDLFETILWEKNNYFLLGLHKNRLERSARNFSFPFPKEGVDRFLKDASYSFETDTAYRLKLILKKSGKINLFSWPLDPPTKLPVKVAFSRKKVDKDNFLLYHKTTKRDLYNEELMKYRTKGLFEVLFTNQDDEITEGAITNVMIKKGESYFTPPVSSGILPGTYRSYLLSLDDFPLTEKVLYKDDILNCDQLYLMNSIRKTLPATLLES